MIRGRDARDADRQLLAEFPCPSHGSYASDVEDMLAEVLDWKDDRPDRVVRIFDSPQANAVAVLAYEEIEPQRPTEGVYVMLFAVRRGHERRGVGMAILSAFIHHLQIACPDGVVMFRVDCQNQEMLALCSRYANTEPTICEDNRDFFEYVVSVPTADDALPSDPD